MKKKQAAQKSSIPLPLPILATALKGIAEGVLVTRMIGRKLPKIIFANDYFCTLTGYTAKELIGQDLRAVHGPKVRATLLEGTFTGEGHLQKKDRTTFYASWSGNSVRQRGKLHIITVYRDLSELRRLNEALLSAQKLEVADQLAGGVAHDFNNLLSVITGYCEILEDRMPASAKFLREVREIHRAGLQAAELTRQLLAFSRRLPLEVKTISINDFIRDAAELLRRLLGPANKFELKLSPEATNIRVDPGQLQQVLLNLMLNSRDAMPDGGTVTVSTHNQIVPLGLNRRLGDLRPGRYVVMSVGDTGIGMDNHVKQHLFEPFFTTKGPGKGTGLGLATVFGTVRQSDGFIEVRSEIGQGSTLEVYFPEISAPAETWRKELNGTGSVASKGNESVLLFEEDGTLSKMLAGLLTSSGYKVQIMDSFISKPKSKSAIPKVNLLIGSFTRRARRQQGAHLVHTLLSVKPGLKILDTSAETLLPCIPELPVGALAHLPKPFALNELLKKIRFLLDTPAGR